MIQYLILVISLISLYLAIVWISFLYLKSPEVPMKVQNFPFVSIVVPAFNEEKNIKKTLSSLFRLDYPKDKLRIIVVNDGSTDNTKAIVQKIIKNRSDTVLINKKNEGTKAAAVNAALKITKSELFGCVDADSSVSRNSLKNMIFHFHDKKTAAVISALKVEKPKKFFEKIQRIEYIMAILSRKLRASIDTLAITPGVLSIYKTSVLKKLGGFDQDNITEDFEIALRLKYNNYNIKIESSALTTTRVPDNFRAFWNQRIRWYRGYIFNHIKYKDMFFNKKYGLLGYFQLPLNIFGIGLMLASISLITYSIIDRVAEFFVRIMTINGYFSNLFYIPTFKEFILSHNTKLMIPIYASSIAGLILFYIAHKQSQEKIRHPFTLISYFVVYPYLVVSEWVSAFSQEARKSKRKW